MVVWSSNSTGQTEPKSRNPTIVLMGYAGSPRSHLEKFEEMYVDMGYRTICAILPQKLLFSYDIPGIQLSALKLAREIEDSGAESIVAHCFSNNGVALYQQLYNQLHQREGKGLIKGLILDSGPGPIGIYDNLLKRNFKDKQSWMFFPFALFGINAANRVGLIENFKQIYQQLRALRVNWPLYRSVPFTGKFMSEVEAGTWPVLLLYSKEDAMMPWNYISRIGEIQGTRRRVSSQLFQGSGHVAHFKVHPQLYQQTVKTFLQGLDKP